MGATKNLKVHSDCTSKNKFKTKPMAIKLREIPTKDFSNDQIDNCYYVDRDERDRLYRVEMKRVFDWIKDRAKEEGIVVELQGNNRILLSECGKLKNK